MSNYGTGMADSLQLHCHCGGREMLSAEAAELILASGTAELWQHPGDVGLASPSPYVVLNCSLWTVLPARQKYDEGKLLLICHFWTRQVSTSVLWSIEPGLDSQSSLSICECWIQVTPIQTAAIIWPVCDAVSCCSGGQSILPGCLYSSSPKI